MWVIFINVQAMKDFLLSIYGAMVLTIEPMELQFESYTTIYIYIYISGRIQRSYDTRGKTGSKIAACSGKDSKDNNSNSRWKSAKEIAAFEGLGELQRTNDTRGETGS